MSERNRAPKGIDPLRPNAARVYNYMLDGKDNYEADRAVGDRMLQVAPDTKSTAWYSRRFLLLAVESAAREGIEQFVDIGAGIPISPNVHEVAQQIVPTAKVASIDYDPVVFVHSNALLTGAPGVTPILADLRNIDELIEAAEVDAGIDWSRPVCVLIVGVLHFVMDDEKPYEIIARLRDAMAPGSMLAFQHASTSTHEFFQNTSTNDTKNSPAQVAFRPPSQVERFLDGFEVEPPGVVPAQRWLDDRLPETRLVVLCGIGRKV